MGVVMNETASKISNNSDLKRFRRIIGSMILLTFFLLQPCYAADVGVFWKPPFLPFKLHLGSDGISVQGDASVVTPIGAFGIGASVPVIESPKPVTINNISVEKNDLLLVIRNKNKWGDKVYKITDGNDISVFTDGETMILAKNGNVLIDVSNGNVREIKFAGKIETLSGSPNRTIPVELKIWHQDKTDKILKPLPQGGTLHSGDLYKIVFRTPENSYVYVFNTDDAGKVRRLFPMKALNDVTVNNANPVKGGNTCYIPAAGQSFKLDADTGTGKIWYLAMKNPDPKLEHQDFEQGASAPVINYLDSLCKECVGVVTFTHR